MGERLGGRSSFSSGCIRAFTLIELLVVMAIITLLLGILVPSLNKAREHGRKVRVRAELRSIGDALELYRNENEDDKSARETSGYPPSAMVLDDPAYSNPDGSIWGAHLLVRFLMGKDLKGYAPRRNVPGNLLDPTNTDNEEEAWYGTNPDGSPVVDRVGPYIEGVRAIRTADLPGYSEIPPVPPAVNPEALVFRDLYGYPILYYVNDPKAASSQRAYVARYKRNSTYLGIYCMQDNAVFTGQCDASACERPGINLGAGTDHPFGKFGFPSSSPPSPATITQNPKTFPALILDRAAYEATYNATNPNQATAAPHRRDSYILVSAGRDGIYGTTDDVTNY